MSLDELLQVARGRLSVSLATSSIRPKSAQRPKKDVRPDILLCKLPVWHELEETTTTGRTARADRRLPRSPGVSFVAKESPNRCTPTSHAEILGKSLAVC